MAGLNLQNAVDQGLTKVASATAAAKSIEEQKKSIEEQEKLRKSNEEHAKEIQARNNQIIALDYGMKLNDAENKLYLHDLNVANEIRKEPGKEGFHFVDNNDIKDYYNRKYLEYDNKYTMAVLNRDMAMFNPRYKDKRTRAGRAFSKAEKEMDMYHKAELEIIQQMNLHSSLLLQKDKFKKQLELVKANADEFTTDHPDTTNHPDLNKKRLKPNSIESTFIENDLHKRVRPV